MDENTQKSLNMISQIIYILLDAEETIIRRDRAPIDEIGTYICHFELEMTHVYMPMPLLQCEYAMWNIDQRLYRKLIVSTIILWSVIGVGGRLGGSQQPFEGVFSGGFVVC